MTDRRNVRTHKVLAGGAIVAALLFVAGAVVARDNLSRVISVVGVLLMAALTVFNLVSARRK